MRVLQADMSVELQRMFIVACKYVVCTCNDIVCTFKYGGFICNDIVSSCNYIHIQYVHVIIQVHSVYMQMHTRAAGRHVGGPPANVHRRAP